MAETPYRNFPACRARGRNIRPAIYAGIIALILACLLLPCATKRCSSPVSDNRPIKQRVTEGINQGIKDFPPADNMNNARYPIRHSVKSKKIENGIERNIKSEPKVYDFGTKLELITDPNEK